MTKKLLYLMAGVVVVLLQAPAFAQNPKPPNYCKPCLFYGGDFGDASVANGLANEQDLIDSNAQVWVPFDVPKAQQWKVTGLFTNDLSSVSVLDPQKAVWSIATGVSRPTKPFVSWLCLTISPLSTGTLATAASACRAL